MPRYEFFRTVQLEVLGLGRKLALQHQKFWACRGFDKPSPGAASTNSQIDIIQKPAE